MNVLFVKLVKKCQQLILLELSKSLAKIVVIVELVKPNIVCIQKHSQDRAPFHVTDAVIAELVK